MNEELSPEARHKLADIVPRLAVIIGAEDQGQILRMISRKKVHGGKQKSVGMAYERGRAEISSRKCVCFVLGVEIVYDRADRRAATCQTNAAFFALGRNVKFVFRLIGESDDITFGFVGRFPMNEISFSALTVINIVVGFTAGKPFKVDRIRLRYDAANINITDLRQKRTIRRVTPSRCAFHKYNHSFLR